MSLQKMIAAHPQVEAEMCRECAEDCRNALPLVK